MVIKRLNNEPEYYFAGKHLKEVKRIKLLFSFANDLQPNQRKDLKFYIDNFKNRNVPITTPNTPATLNITAPFFSSSNNNPLIAPTICNPKVVTTKPIIYSATLC